METREQIEKKLLGYIEELSKIKKDCPDYKNFAKYQRLEGLIPTYIWKYAEILYPKGIKNSEKNIVCHVSDSGVEINEFARHFVETFEYNPKNGPVLNYITKILNQKILSAGTEKDKMEKRKGIRLSDNKNDDSVDKSYRNLVIACKHAGKKLSDPGIVEWLAENTGKNQERIAFLISSHNFSFEEADNGCSIFDGLTEGELYKEYNSEQEDKCKGFFEKIEQCYRKQRVETRKALLPLITFTLLKDFEKSKEKSRELIADLLSPYSFVDKTILDSWKEGNALGTQKEIAQKLRPGIPEDAAEAYASTTFNRFRDRLFKTL